jgi:hypothetical protein
MHQKLVPHRHTALELYGLDVLVDDSLHCLALGSQYIVIIERIGFVSSTAFKKKKKVR